MGKEKRGLQMVMGTLVGGIKGKCRALGSSRLVTVQFTWELGIMENETERARWSSLTMKSMRVSGKTEN